MDILTLFWSAILLGSILTAIFVARRTSTGLLLLGFVSPCFVAVAYWALEECFAGINTSETCTWGVVLLPLYAAVACACGAFVYLIWMAGVYTMRWIIGIKNG